MANGYLQRPACSLAPVHVTLWPHWAPFTALTVFAQLCLCQHGRAGSQPSFGCFCLRGGLTEDPCHYCLSPPHCVSPSEHFSLFVISRILVYYLTQGLSLLLGWKLHGGKNPSALFTRCPQQEETRCLLTGSTGKGSSRAWTATCGRRPFSRVHENKYRSGPLTGSIPGPPASSPTEVGTGALTLAGGTAEPSSSCFLGRARRGASEPTTW